MKNSKNLEDVYHHDFFEFDTDTNIKEIRPVVWADAQELLEIVLQNRRDEIDEVYNVKVMADGGQGFFKVTMSVFPESQEENCEKENSGTSSKKDSYLYSQGGSTAKKYKLTSVKRLLFLCIVPLIKETYHNAKFLFSLIDINRISFKFVCDFKLLLIVNGQQTASATYPCPYCFVTLYDLKIQTFLNKLETIKNADEDVLSVSDDCLKLKTFGGMRNDYDSFCSLGHDKKLAKQCHSTVNPLIFDEANDIYIIQKFLVPELYIFQGFVNHLYNDGLVPLLGEEKAFLWPRKLKLVQKTYHGHIFEGNACSTLLKNPDILSDPEICKEVGSLAVVPFISAFKAMDNVVKCCFSETVGDNLNQLLCELVKAYESTGVSTTLKIHVIFNHLLHCLHFMNHSGFGKWSEQAGESVHQEFLKHWERFKVPYVNNEKLYAINLKKAVIEFSSHNL